MLDKKISGKVIKNWLVCQIKKLQRFGKKKPLKLTSSKKVFETLMHLNGQCLYTSFFG